VDEEQHSPSLHSCVPLGGGWKTWQQEDLLLEVKESSEGESKREKRGRKKQTEIQPATN
jgi:hypothetical protein